MPLLENEILSSYFSHINCDGINYKLNDSEAELYVNNNSHILWDGITNVPILKYLRHNYVLNPYRPTHLSLKCYDIINAHLEDIDSSEITNLYIGRHYEGSLENINFNKLTHLSIEDDYYGSLKNAKLSSLIYLKIVLINNYHELEKTDLKSLKYLTLYNNPLNWNWINDNLLNMYIPNLKKITFCNNDKNKDIILHVNSNMKSPYI